MTSSKTVFFKLCSAFLILIISAVDAGDYENPTITADTKASTSKIYQGLYHNQSNQSARSTIGTILNSNLNNNNNKNNGCVERPLDLRTIMFIILLVCVFIVGIASNGLAIVVIFASRSLRRHPTNLLVASLNLCDIGVILCSVPIRLDDLAYNRFCFDIHVCRFFNVTDMLFHISSISHLFAIAIERCVAVRAPFFHRYSLTSRRILQVAGATWLYSAIWAGLSMFDWEYPHALEETSKIVYVAVKGGLKRSCILHNRLYNITVYIVIYLVPLTIMAVMYALILRAVTRHRARMQVNTTTTSTAAPIVQNIHYQGQNQNHHHQQNKDRSNSRNSISGKRHKKHKRTEDNLSKTVAIIYGTFVVCWLPITIITIVYQLCPVACFTGFRNGSPVAFDAIITLFIIVLPAIHSCLNPFVYIIFHRTFRTAVQELIGRRLRNESHLDRRPFQHGATYRTKMLEDANGAVNNL